MADDITTILDHIDNITVKGNPFADPSNEYYALLCLRSGLGYLYDFVSKYDQMALKQLDPNKRYFSFGNSPLLTGIPYQLITCAFHWYSISACQYIRTIGAIAYFQDNSRLIPPKYVESIIPEVLAFRDKVAAHFAWSSKHSQDNEAERLASIIPQVAFVDDSFQVGALTVSKKTRGTSSSSKTIKPWSITKIHQCLRQRYWPEELKAD